MPHRILTGDACETLRTLPAASAQCCVTSPPYFGLRSYGGGAAEVGREASPEEYVARLVQVMAEVRRVLRPDGTLWLNLGDSYAANGAKTLGRNDAGRNIGGRGGNTEGSGNPGRQGTARFNYGAKPKDLLGIPWRVAFALQADGWFLRSAIIWHKPNPMPESVRDRPTNAYEFVFLLSSAPAYFYDAEAVREPNCATVQRSILRHAGSPAVAAARKRGNLGTAPDRADSGKALRVDNNAFSNPAGRNQRNVWTITPQPFRGAHFATMPPELAARCIRAGSRPGDTVLDPFGGSGTTALAARDLGRDAVLCELSAEYVAIAEQRLAGPAPRPAKPHAPRPAMRPPEAVPPLLARVAAE
jgi:DNA modification methylase